MLAWVLLRCLRQASLAAAARASLCLATLSQTTTRAGGVLAVVNQPGRTCEYGVAAGAVDDAVDSGRTTEALTEAWAGYVAPGRSCLLTVNRGSQSHKLLFLFPRRLGP